MENRAIMDSGILSYDGFPNCSIGFDDEFQYIGGETFLLYNVARCEIHLFADLDTTGYLDRLYWLQFEEYLPRNQLPFPQNLKPFGNKYNYSDEPEKIEIDRRPFYARTYFMNIAFTDDELKAESGPRDSDFDHVARLFYRNDIDLNGDVLGMRMVHLDPARRKELMIIYYERMGRIGLTMEELKSAGKQSDLWQTASEKLRERVLANISITFK